MRKLTADDNNGLVQSFEIDDASGTVAVRHTQDIEPFMDHVAAVNAAGGPNDVEGLGRLMVEVPIGLAIDFCNRRGIAWEAFMAGQHDEEWTRVIKEYSRLAYRHQSKTFAVKAA